MGDGVGVERSEVERNWVSGQPCWHEQQAERRLRSSAVCPEWNFLCKTSPLVQFVSTVLGDIFAFSHQGPSQQMFNSVCQLSSCPPEYICTMLGDTGPQRYSVRISLFSTPDDSVSAAACLDHGNQIKAQMCLAVL